MPFTPFHMGPGILFKSVLHGGFSLMVFGWSQIVIDIQPLVVILTGEGHMHGITHTYAAATLPAVFAALTGKYPAELGLVILRLGGHPNIAIRWRVAFVSAFIGCYSHVFIDSLMHEDMQPFLPFSALNPLLHRLSDPAVHYVCVLAGLVGAVVYFTLQWRMKRNG